MKQIYIIKGLDCANCALNLEKKISKINGVSSCNINFLAEKMIIDLDEKSINEVLLTCQNFEDGVQLKRIK